MQEYKEWQGLLDHIRSLPDMDGDGLADIPTQGAAAEQRMRVSRACSRLSCTATPGRCSGGVSLVLLARVLLIVWLLRRRRLRRD